MSKFPGPEKLRIIQLLIDNGARVNARAWYEHGWNDNRCRNSPAKVGPSVVEVACKYIHDCIPLIILFLKYGAELDPPSGYICSTALEIACDREDIDLVNFLLHAGATPTYRSPCIHRSLSMYILEPMLEKGLDINAWNTRTVTCNSELVKLLLQRGHNINHVNLLKIACSKRDMDLIKLLLEQGTDPNPTDIRSSGPLAKVARLGDIGTALLLLEAGARVSVGDAARCGRACPLIAAAREGRLDMVALLLASETRVIVWWRASLTAGRRKYLAIVSYIQQYVNNKAPPYLRAQFRELELNGFEEKWSHQDSFSESDDDRYGWMTDVCCKDEDDIPAVSVPDSPVVEVPEPPVVGVPDLEEDI